MSSKRSFLRDAAPLLIIAAIFIALVSAATIGPTGMSGFTWINATNIDVDDIYRGGVNYTTTVEALIVAGAGNSSAVSKNGGATIGPRSILNFIEGTNISLTIVDDPGGDEIDITITSTGGAGSNDLPYYHAVVSSNSSNVGRPRYFITDSHDDQIQINQAILSTVSGYSEDRVLVLIEPGFYDISDPILVDEFYPKNGTVHAYGAEFFLESGRPNSVSGDDEHHWMMSNEDHPLNGFRWSGGDFDANKDGNPVGSINQGGAIIYLDHSGHDVILTDVFVHDGTMRGIMTKARSGDYSGVNYIRCTAWDVYIDGLKFAMSSGGIYKEFYASNMIDCTVGGEIGDIGFDLFDQNLVGLFYDIGFYGSTVFPLTGVDGTGPGHWAFKLENTARNCVIDGFVIHDADSGIGINNSGGDEETEGGNIISNGIITMGDNSTGFVTVAPVGIVLKSTYNQISNVVIIGSEPSADITSAQKLIYVLEDNNYIEGVTLINGSDGIELESALYTRINGGASRGNGKGIELKTGADYSTIIGWSFDDDLGIEVDSGCVNATIAWSDFRQSTADQTDAGTSTQWWFNWDVDGNFDGTAASQAP